MNSLSSNAYFANDNSCLNPTPSHNLIAADTRVIANYIMTKAPEGAIKIKYKLSLVSLPNI